MVTLFFTLWTSRTRYREERRDEYRAVQRQAIAELAVAFHVFRRTCHPEAPTAPPGAADQLTLDLLAKFTIVWLLIDDSVLRERLTAAHDAWTDLSGDPATVDPDQAWRQFDQKVDDLNQAARRTLRPSVVRRWWHLTR